MSRRVLTLAAALALTLIPALALRAAEGDEAKRLAAAATVLDEIMGAADKGIPRSIMEKAEAVAVFPSMLKGGLVVGAQHGRGVISARDKKNGGWSSPAFLSITGGSFGAQIGAQAIDLVLVVNNQRGLEQLVQNQFKIGADAGVAAGPVGREAAAATDIQLRAQILSYSRARGLFAGVTINGSTISQDRDANDRFYGMGYRTGQIIFDGLGDKPAAADAVATWKTTLGKYGK